MGESTVLGQYVCTPYLAGENRAAAATTTVSSDYSLAVCPVRNVEIIVMHGQTAALFFKDSEQERN